MDRKYELAAFVGTRSSLFDFEAIAGKARHVAGLQMPASDPDSPQSIC